MDVPSDLDPGPPSRSRPNVIRRLYDWVLGWAETPYGVPALVVLAFMESSFFPIPPDVLLIALALAVPTRAFRFALWCTVGSVAGGAFGYYIGHSAWSTFEPYLINRVITEENFRAVTEKYREHGALAVFAAAFTIIPYKVFTIAAGVFQLDFLSFVGASLVGRGARFLLVAWLILWKGAEAKAWIERHFNLATAVGAILLIGGFLLVKLLR